LHNAHLILSFCCCVVLSCWSNLFMLSPLFMLSSVALLSCRHHLPHGAHCEDPLRRCSAGPAVRKVQAQRLLAPRSYDSGPGDHTICFVLIQLYDYGRCMCV
jgi:hypothetical protein